MYEKCFKYVIGGFIEMMTPLGLEHLAVTFSTAEVSPKKGVAEANERTTLVIAYPSSYSVLDQSVHGDIGI
jgi:hypothetical protein